MAIASATASTAFAQEATDAADDEEAAVVEEVIVTGMRKALSTAQDLKRDASTVIESITAEDLGSFPDKSIAEALQRVAGITVNRFAATGDTAHFSAEPSGVVVRGLNQVRTEFNGRDSFSANSSRGLSWTDVSPELMAGVDTYKNQMAELIEGGLAGTVNMRTRVPFDQDGEMFAATVSANYGDLAEEVTPDVSGLYSNRWDTSVGEFGFLANFAYSQVETRSEGIQLYRMNRFRDVYQEDTLNFIPASVAMRDNLYDRERKGIALAAQWQNPEESIVATVQYNRSEYENNWEEYVVAIAAADLSYGQSVFYEVPSASAPQPAPDTGDFTWDENGLFQTGVMTADIGWWGADDAASAGYGANAAGEPFVVPCYGWNGCEPAKRGSDFGTTTRAASTTNVTEDLGFNIKWNISDTVRSNFDVQYVHSEVDSYDIETSFSSFANLWLDMSGEHPEIELLDPLNVNLSPGQWTNPNNYYLHHIMDHIEDSEGDQFAARVDFEFDLASDWFESVKVGARYAKRDQEVKWSNYNWQNVSNTWTSNQAAWFNLDQHDADEASGFNGYPEGYYINRAFESDYLNISPNEFVFANPDLLANQALMASTMSAEALGFTGGTGWDPICSNMGDRSGEIPGTCFIPSEIADVTEETQAFYVQLNFGGADAELFGIPVSGNIGVRYVKTEDSSVGGTAYPRLGDEYFYTWELVETPTGEADDPATPDYDESVAQSIVKTPDPTRTILGDAPVLASPEGLPPVPYELGYYLTAEDAAFMNGGSVASTSVTDHTNILPSFNLKLDLTDEVILRFALSKAMSRPDMGNLRNYTGLGATFPDLDNANDGLWVKNAAGEITGANVYYSGSAQNPELTPIEAVQADISLEYYFADVGYVTLALFKKEFDDYIQYVMGVESFTNNGVTETAEVRRPRNGEGAGLQGFEIAFQRYFDFLPEPFDGFGVQANYTYIDNQGIGNTNVSNVGDGSTDVEAAAIDQVEVNKLEGLSEDSYNLVAMYEKGDFAARLAYSWRSEYLVTAIDCCVVLPIWQDDSGYLDGSISYDITDNLTVRFQGSNLLNEETVLRQQVENDEDGGRRLPNAWFQNDRRYTLTLSLKY